MPRSLRRIHMNVKKYIPHLSCLSNVSGNAKADSSLLKVSHPDPWHLLIAATKGYRRIGSIKSCRTTENGIWIFEARNNNQKSLPGRDMCHFHKERNGWKVSERANLRVCDLKRISKRIEH